MTPPTIPLGVPTSIVAGDSATWDDPALSHAQYGAFSSTDGWVLTYRFTGRKQQATVVGATQGTGWRMAMTAQQTATLKDAGSGVEPEPIQYLAQATKGTDAFTLLSGVVTLFPDPTSLKNGQTSAAQDMLVLVRAAIKSLVTNGIKSAQIQGRAYTKNDLSELRRLEAFYASKVWREAHPGQLGPAIVGRFISPS